MRHHDGERLAVILGLIFAAMLFAAVGCASPTEPEELPWQCIRVDSVAVPIRGGGWWHEKYIYCWAATDTISVPQPHVPAKP